MQNTSHAVMAQRHEPHDSLEGAKAHYSRRLLYILEEPMIITIIDKWSP